MGRRNRGRGGNFTIMGVVALLTITTLFPSVLTSFQVLKKYEKMDEFAQDEIATYQLRRVLILGDNFSVKEDSLSFTYRGDRWTISIKNNHVYMQPGTQIFYNQVDEGYFDIEDGMIFISLRRDKIWIKRVLING